ncbi:hypothetical protein L1281_000665 [Neisseria sp. HSC-16F19]|nr:hypothetical protein [Neisseria sp. HSC-16F19]MCP2040085.1 hypothetical protein [Neisseria sp. HSC-16F19]
MYYQDLLVGSIMLTITLLPALYFINLLYTALPVEIVVENGQIRVLRRGFFRWQPRWEAYALDECLAVLTCFDHEGKRHIGSVGQLSTVLVLHKPYLPPVVLESHDALKPVQGRWLRWPQYTDSPEAADFRQAFSRASGIPDAGFVTAKGVRQAVEQVRRPS